MRWLTKSSVNLQLHNILILFTEICNFVSNFYRVEVEAKLRQLEKAEPQRMTRLDFGLRQANNQIERLGERRASVVILLTDGKLSPTVTTNTVRQVSLKPFFFNWTSFWFLVVDQRLGKIRSFQNDSVVKTLHHRKHLSHNHIKKRTTRNCLLRCLTITWIWRKPSKQNYDSFVNDRTASIILVWNRIAWGYDFLSRCWLRNYMYRTIHVF